MRRFAILLLCCAGFYLLLFQLFRSLTDVGELRTNYPQVIYNAKADRAHIEIVKKRPPGWVPLSQISPIAYNAIVLSEDWAFWQHNGFDWDQLIDAFKTNLKKGRFARGGSTITQQVVKNVYLSNEKTLTRKAREAVLTIRIERHLNKKRILEIYLNIAQFGQGLYGIGPASRLYFQKAPAELNAKEGAFLAMLLPSPKKYSVSFRKKELTPFARSSVQSILGKLMATKRLSEAEYEAALATPLSFEAVPMPLPSAEELPVIDDEDEGGDSADEAGGDGGY